MKRLLTALFILIGLFMTTVTTKADGPNNWLILGQSNAAAPLFSGSAAADIRDYIKVESGGTWYVAQGDSNLQVDFAGQWEIHRQLSLFLHRLFFTSRIDL